RSRIQGAPRRRLRRTHGVVGGRGGAGRGGVRRLQRRRRQHGAPEAPGWIRDLLSAPLVVRRGRPRGGARRAGPADRPRRGAGRRRGAVGTRGPGRGRHLASRLKRNGGFVNPAPVHSRQAPGEPIPTTQLAAFKTSRDTLRSQLTNSLVADAAPEKPDAVAAVS